MSHDKSESTCDKSISRVWSQSDIINGTRWETPYAVKGEEAGWVGDSL